MFILSNMDVANGKQENGGKKKKLNFRQREFCKYFASDTEFFGNGIQSYGKAYKLDLSKKSDYNTAKVNASKLLTNTNILAYINELLEVTLNEAHADKQLAMLMTQNADFGTKMAAIREFNALKQRIIRKMEHSGSLTFTEALSKASNDQNN